MAQFRLELFDKTNVTREAIIPRAFISNAIQSEELNDVNTLDFTVSPDYPSFSSLSEFKIVRLYNLDDNTFDTFRIRQVIDTRSRNDIIARILKCEHLKYDMLDETYRKWTPYVGATATAVLTDIFTDSAFSLGTISSATKIDITLNYGSVLELVEDVRSVLGSDLVVNEDKTVSFISRGTNRNARIRYSKNLKGIIREIDTRDLFNRVFPVGAGEPPASISNDDGASLEAAEHIVTSVSGATIQAHNRLVSSDDSWNDHFIKVTRANKSSALDTIVTISDSSAFNQLVLSSSIPSLEVGDYFRIQADATDNPVKGIRDAVSIAANGTIESELLNSSILRARNLALSPSFSGTYADAGDGDQDDKWTAVKIGGGSVSFSENTSAAFIRNGSSSQKVETADSEEGVSQNITLEVDSFYSFYIWVFIDSGSVKIELNDGTNDQPTFLGEVASSNVIGSFVRIQVEGIKAVGTSGVIKILSTSANSTFYIDSFFLEKSASLTSPEDFYEISGARRLWDLGFDELQKFKNTKNKYTVSIVDLFQADPDSFPYDQLEIGDTVTVQDDELGIDITARIQKKTFDIVEPYNASLEIDNFRERISKTIRSETIKNKRERRKLALLKGKTDNDKQTSGSDLRVSSVVPDNQRDPVS